MNQSDDQPHDLSCDFQFYDIIFPLTCQFSQKPDFQIILDGDDASPQVAIVSQPSKCLKFMTFWEGCSVKHN